jgi:CheY-like chemotaxis protein
MNGEKYIVYIVDDDVDDLEILSEAFQNSGCASVIKCFTSGIALFDSLGLKHFAVPDIIILDHYLSLSDGADIPERIRDEKIFDSVTLALYSSALQPVKVQQLLQNGVDVCRQKGNSAEELKSDVESFCKAIKNKQKK